MTQRSKVVLAGRVDFTIRGLTLRVQRLRWDISYGEAGQWTLKLEPFSEDMERLCQAYPGMSAAHPVQRFRLKDAFYARHEEISSLSPEHLFAWEQGALLQLDSYDWMSFSSWFQEDEAGFGKLANSLT